MSRAVKHWALVVAAGTGSRMGADIPKQYLSVAGRSVLEHSLGPFIRHPTISGIVLVLAPDDHRFDALQMDCNKPLIKATGGASRAESVANGLGRLRTKAEAQDWVLVHDAARPCLADEDLQRLIDTLAGDACGGLLAVPARDTLKAAADDAVCETLAREQIWQAQTPQMFRLGLLQDALTQALVANRPVTDESGALEQAGYAPKLVAGSFDNIKLTHESDLPMIEAVLLQREGT